MLRLVDEDRMTTCGLTRRKLSAPWHSILIIDTGFYWLRLVGGGELDKALAMHSWSWRSIHVDINVSWSLAIAAVAVARLVFMRGCMSLPVAVLRSQSLQFLPQGNAFSQETAPRLLLLAPVQSGRRRTTKVLRRHLAQKLLRQ